MRCSSLAMNASSRLSREPPTPTFSPPSSQSYPSRAPRGADRPWNGRCSRRSPSPGCEPSRTWGEVRSAKESARRSYPLAIRGWSARACERRGPSFSSPAAVPRWHPRSNTSRQEESQEAPRALRGAPRWGLLLAMSNPPTHGSRQGPREQGARILGSLGHLPPDFEEARSFAVPPLPAVCLSRDRPLFLVIPIGMPWADLRRR